MLHAAPPARPKRDTEVSLFLDADYLAYSCAAVVQYKQDDPSKDLTPVWLWEGEDSPQVWIESVSNAEFLLKSEIDRIKNRFASDDITVFLTPRNGNFRDDVATTKPYKGTRFAPKPYFYQAMRDKMLDDHGAVMCHGIEADDAVATAQKAAMQQDRLSVIVSQDKDCLTMYGPIYVPRTQTLHFQTPERSLRFFCEQLVTGDSADNIPGLPGKGIRFFEKEAFRHENTRALLQSVFNRYRERENGTALLREQATLLHLRREEGEQWTEDYDYEHGYRSVEELPDFPEMLSGFQSRGGKVKR